MRFEISESCRVERCAPDRSGILFWWLRFSKPPKNEELVKNLSLYYMNGHLKKKPIAKYHRQIDSSGLHEREKFKKKAEILLLNSFLHHFPSAKFENLTCESPDFIAKLNDKKIGIELTEVINHLEIKKTESILNKIFRKAELLLESEDTAKFRGVYFLDFKNISKVDLVEKCEEITQNIIKCIKERKPSKFIRSVRKSAHRRNVFITHDYRPELFDPLSSEKIISLIHKKNEKFPYYDRSVDECWLVIVSDMNSLASRYTFIEDGEKLRKVQSPFDRILHLENLYGGITVVK